MISIVLIYGNTLLMTKSAILVERYTFFQDFKDASLHRKRDHKHYFVSTHQTPRLFDMRISPYIARHKPQTISK